jgi:protoheme IX farnesyltransferase
LESIPRTPLPIAEHSSGALAPRTVGEGVVRDSVVRDWTELVKPRLSALVVVTASMGYLLGAGGLADSFTLFVTALGTFLLAGGACGMNHALEVAPDGRMRRTRNRPLPAGRLARGPVLLFSLSLSGIGAAMLFARAGALTGWLGVASFLVYVVVYTPLKRVTTLNTVVGAIVGALPPMMGWAAATGGLESGAWVLGALLFVWQIPHFLAIAWMYRGDYARGGFRMLPVADPGGRSTAAMVVLYGLALIPVSLAAAPIRPTGWLYPVAALALGAAFLLLGVRFYRERTVAAARSVFLASIVYLPVLFLLMVFDPTRA